MINQIIQSASATWKIALENYKSSDGWTLKYYFRGPGAGADLTATAENDDFVLSLSSAQTSAFVVGEYAWQSFAEKGSEKVFIAEGVIQVKQGFAGSDAGDAVDTRSEIKKILDAVDAMMKGKASLDQLSYTIGNRQLARYSMADLILLREKYQQLYNQEKIAARIKKGGGLFKNHLIRLKG